MAAESLTHTDEILHGIHSLLHLVSKIVGLLLFQPLSHSIATYLDHICYFFRVQAWLSGVDRSSNNRPARPVIDFLVALQVASHRFGSLC